MDGEGSDVQTAAEAQKEREDALKQAQEVVKELYWLNTHYFEQHDVESAGKKESDVREKLQQTLSTLKSLEGLLSKEQFCYLKGKALNVLADHDPEAESLLASAIKRDPGLADAWVSLGESYWKKGNIQQAHDCFTSSLNHTKTKEALRNLSMVLRQMGTTPAEREERVKESVERAKEAIGEDVKDGISWMILGNAYLSLFFMTSTDPKLLKQSRTAYSQAERDSGAANNPDLHYNKATLCLYEESYDEALAGFSRAAALDPGWSVPREKLADTRRFLQAMTRGISTKGRMKSKKLTTLLASLSTPEKFTSSLSETKTVVTASGLSEGSNTGSVFVGGVSAIIPTTGRVPYACSLVDSTGSGIGLSVYNLAVSAHFNIGDIITLPDPTFKHVQLDKEKVDFGSLRCTDPRLLLVNGERLSADKLATSVVTITNFS